MRLAALTLAAACALCIPGSSAPQTPAKPDASPVVRWKGDSFTGPDLASTIGAKAAATAGVWGAWAQAHGYVLDLDPDATRLFVHAQSRGASSELAILTRSLALVDKLAGKPADVVPAILELEGPKDFGALLDDLGKRFSYLTGWAQGEKQQLGFVLEEPLAAAFLATAPDVKEWNPKNELANRAAQVGLHARFGRLPNWLMQGLAWHVELSVCGSIYCFPFRSGFVAKKEHRSWSQQLTALMAPPAPDGAPRKLAIEDLAGWKRGTYDNDRALLAWGAATYLAKKKPDALPLVLEDFRALRERESKVTKPDGSWTLNPDYEIPAEKQLEILKARAGDEVLAEIERHCRGS